MRKLASGRNLKTSLDRSSLSLRLIPSIIAICAAGIVTGCSDAAETDGSEAAVLPIASNEVGNPVAQTDYEANAGDGGDWNFLLDKCLVTAEVSTSEFAERCDLDGARQAAAQWDGRSAIDIRFMPQIFRERFRENRWFMFYRDSTWATDVPVIEKDTVTLVSHSFKRGIEGAVHVVQLHPENGCEIEYKYNRISDTEVDRSFVRLGENCDDDQRLIYDYPHVIRLTIVSAPKQKLSGGQEATQSVEKSDDVNSSNEILQFAFSREVIGMNPAYLETKLGVPKIISDGFMSFDVEGCSISYLFKNRKITYASMAVSEICGPIIDGSTVTPSVNFDDVIKKNPSFVFFADCLSMCGNAADPTLQVKGGGGRATGNVIVAYHTDYLQSNAAIDQWVKDIELSEGVEDKFTDNYWKKMRCRSDPSEKVQSLMKNMTVKKVTLSYKDSSDPSCGY